MIVSQEMDTGKPNGGPVFFMQFLGSAVGGGSAKAQPLRGINGRGFFEELFNAPGLLPLAGADRRQGRFGGREAGDMANGSFVGGGAYLDVDMSEVQNVETETGEAGSEYQN